MTTQTQDLNMTERQAAYMRSLLGTRVVPADQRTAIERALALGTLSRERASTGISWLLSRSAFRDQLYREMEQAAFDRGDD